MQINGIFPYSLDDISVTFNISTLELGTFYLKNLNPDKRIVTGKILSFKRNNTRDKTLIKILRIIQSLDDDPKESIINISDEIKTKITN